MGFNTFPCNPYPISTEELNKGNNDDLNTRVAALESDVSDLNSNKANQITIAPFFNAEASYSVGDLVYYNGLTYRCTNDHEGEWDADDFAATTIAGELDTLKSGLTNWEVAGQASTDSATIKSQTNTLYVNRALRKVRLVANITFNAYNDPNKWIVMYYIPDAYVPQVIQSGIICIGDAKVGMITKNNVNGIIAFTPTDAIAENDTSDVCFEWYY